MLFAFVLAFVAAFMVSANTCGLVRRFAPQLGLLDKPGERKIHTTPIPVGGGLGIGLGVLMTFAAGSLLLLLLPGESLRAILPNLASDFLAMHRDGLVHRSAQLWTLLGLATILLALGTLDDRYNLSWKPRLGIQTLVAMAAVGQGWRLTAFMDAPLLTDALSVIWIVGLVNSFNMLDNMNGLSAGVAAICAAFLAAVMFITPNPLSQQPQFFVAGFLIVLVGAIAGFLLYNNPFRASMFMGDGGAYFIGFLLAVTTLSATFAGYSSAGYGSEHKSTPQTLYVPLLILAVPLYDTMTVVLIRLKNGKSPFVGDKNHFSHRLVDLGLSKTLAVLTVYLTTAICCIGAVLLYRVDFFGATLIFFQTLLVLLLVGLMEYAARKKEQRKTLEPRD